MRPATDHRRLLPHERWAVHNQAKRNMVIRNRYMAQVYRKNGAEGVFWWSAALGNLWIGYPLGFVGIILLVSAGGYGAVSDVGGWLLLLAFPFGIMFVVRAIQGRRAGLAFRKERRDPRSEFLPK
jgi:hypothetical protein